MAATDAAELAPSAFGLDGEILERMAPKRFEAGAIPGADRSLLTGIADRLLTLIPAGRPDEADAILEVDARRYLDPDIFERERRAIFDRMPIVAGFSCDVPRPGDYRKIEGLRSPMFITRTRAGAVKAYLNACRHRGAALVYESQGSAPGRFTCPYHGWTYSDAGKLIGVPCGEGFEGLDKAGHGLIEVACAERHGIIFVAPNAETPLDLDGFLGAALLDELGLWGFGDVHASRSEPIDLAGNWKLVYDTFLETYHFAAAHRNNLANFFVSNVNTVDRFGPHQRIVAAYRTLRDEYAQAPEAERAPENHMIASYILFPGMILISSAQVVEFFRIAPVSVDRTIVHHACYSRLGLDSDETRGLFEAIWQSAHNIVQNEDFPYGVETAQRSLASGSLPSLVIGRNELAVQNNYRAIAEALATAD